MSVSSREHLTTHSSGTSEDADGQNSGSISRAVQGRGSHSRFPEASYRKLHTDLWEKYTWTVHLEDLARCLQGARDAFSQFESCNLKDQELVSQLCKHTVKAAFDKCVIEKNVKGWSLGIQTWVLRSAMHLMDAATSAMDSLRTYTDLGVFELKAELVSHLMHTVATCVEQNTPFSVLSRQYAIPPEFAQEAGPSDLDEETPVWTRIIANRLRDRGGINRIYETLYTMLLKPMRFRLDHMESLLMPLEKGGCLLHIPHIEMLREDASLEQLTPQQILGRILMYLTEKLKEDPRDLTTDSDPTYTTLSSVFEQIYAILCTYDGQHSADDVVSEAQCHFLDAMLARGSFNAMLAVLRETNALLDRGRLLKRDDRYEKSLERTTKWIKNNSAISKLMHVNMHQRQYAQAVQQLLVALTELEELDEANVLGLWNMLQQEGTKDVVQENVAMLLQEVAKTIDSDHITLLTQQLQTAEVSSLRDACAIFSLLNCMCQNQKIADWTDLAQQCLQLGWNFLLAPASCEYVIAASVSAHDSTQGVMQSRLSQSGVSGSGVDVPANLFAWLAVSVDEEWRGKDREDSLQMINEPPFVAQYIKKCLEQIRSGTGLYAAMHTLFRLVQGMHRVSDVPGSQEWSKLVEGMDKEHSLLDNVLASLERYTDTLPPVGSPVPSNFESIFVVHMDLLQLLIRTKSKLRHEVEGRESEFKDFMTPEIVQRLWTCTVARIPSDHDDCLESSYIFITDLVELTYIQPQALQHLLEQLAPRRASSTLSQAGLTCFYTVLVSVNLSLYHLVPDPDRLSALGRGGYGRAANNPVHIATGTGTVIGANYIFEVLVNNFSEEVASSAILMLVETFVLPYTDFGKAPNKVWHRFVLDCINKLRLYAKFLTGCKDKDLESPHIWVHLAQDGQASSDAKDVAQYGQSAKRTLQLLHSIVSACRGRCLPTVSAHCASGRGADIDVKLCITQPNEFKDPGGFNVIEADHSHTGDTRVTIRVHNRMYVGTLRKWLSEATGMSVNRFLLAHSGQHMKCDGEMFKDLPNFPSATEDHAFVIHVWPIGKVAKGNSYSNLPIKVQDLVRTTAPDMIMFQDGTLYELLMYLLDLPSGCIEVHVAALDLLSALPTWPEIITTLQECMSTPQDAGSPHPQIVQLLNIYSEDSGTYQKRPGAVLYVLESLYAQLRPTEELPWISASPECAASLPNSSTPCMLMGCPNATIQALIGAAKSNYDHNLKDSAFWTRYYTITLHLLKHTTAVSTLSPCTAEAPETSHTNDTPAALAASHEAATTDEAASGPADSQALPVSTGTHRTPMDVSPIRSPELPPLTVPQARAQEVLAHPVSAPDTPANCPQRASEFTNADASAVRMDTDRDEQAAVASQFLSAGGPISPSGSNGSSHRDTSNMPMFVEKDPLPPLEIATLGNLLDFWMKLGARLGTDLANTQLSQTHSHRWPGSEVATCLDQQLLQQVLQQVGTLLKKHSVLFKQMMGSKDVVHMVQELLLHPVLPVLRSSIDSMLRAAILQAGPTAVLWLLQVLSSLRAAADSAPHHCFVYYQLTADTAQALAPAPGNEGISLLHKLLKEEVVALTSAPKVSDENDHRLHGRLVLLASLWDALREHRTALPTNALAQLVNESMLDLVVNKLMFPEARVCAHAGTLPPSELKAALQPCCNTPETRQAAYDLLCTILKDRPDLLRSLITSLNSMLNGYPSNIAILQTQYSNQVFTQSLDGSDILDIPCTRWRGLKNAGATCYMNSVFQQLFMQPTIRTLILSSDPVPVEEEADSVFAQMQLMFANLAESCGTFFTPLGFWSALKDYDGQPINVHEHQDAHEFLQRLQDIIDMHLMATDQPRAIYSAVGGRFVQSIRCRDLEYESERTEPFYQVSLDVQGMRTLEAALDSYFQEELMEGDNAYYCEQVKEKVPAIKRIRIQSLPHTFAVHLKRFEFDFNTQHRSKIKDRFEFPLKLNMQKYTSEGTDSYKSVPPTGPDAAPATQHPAEYYQYDLKGIVVHSGNAFAGHYYSYVKERMNETGNDGQWLWFDDTNVTEWDPCNLDNDCFGGRSSHNEMDKQNSAFMVFYERAAELEPIRIMPELQMATSLNRRQKRLEARLPVPSSSEGTLPNDSRPMEQDTPPTQPLPASLPTAPVPDAQEVEQSAAEPQVEEEVEEVPWHMPLAMYQRVMQENLRTRQANHLTNPKHIKFVADICEQAIPTDYENDKLRRSLPNSLSSGVRSMSCDTRSEQPNNVKKRLAVEHPPDSGSASPVPCPQVPSLNNPDADVCVLATELAARYFLAVLAYVPTVLNEVDGKRTRACVANGLRQRVTSADVLLTVIRERMSYGTQIFCNVFFNGADKYTRHHSSDFLVEVLEYINTYMLQQDLSVESSRDPVLIGVYHVLVDCLHGCFDAFDRNAHASADCMLDLLAKISTYPKLRCILDQTNLCSRELVTYFKMFWMVTEWRGVPGRIARPYMNLVVNMFVRQRVMQLVYGSRVVCPIHKADVATFVEAHADMIRVAWHDMSDTVYDIRGHTERHLGHHFPPCHMELLQCLQISNGKVSKVMIDSALSQVQMKLEPDLVNDEIKSPDMIFRFWYLPLSVDDDFLEQRIRMMMFGGLGCSMDRIGLCSIVEARLSDKMPTHATDRAIDCAHMTACLFFMRAIESLLSSIGNLFCTILRTLPPPINNHVSSIITNVYHRIECMPDLPDKRRYAEVLQHIYQIVATPTTVPTGPARDSSPEHSRSTSASDNEDRDRDRIAPGEPHDKAAEPACDTVTSNRADVEHEPQSGAAEEVQAVVEEGGNGETGEGEETEK